MCHAKETEKEELDSSFDPNLAPPSTPFADDPFGTLGKRLIRSPDLGDPIYVAIKCGITESEAASWIASGVGKEVITYVHEHLGEFRTGMYNIGTTGAYINEAELNDDIRALKLFGGSIVVWTTVKE